ncbi:hypothetical protein JOE48_001252 [Methylobacterium sp. PvR107]|nr:hypothetical protein [Methylobacterium sp. PvR107]
MVTGRQRLAARISIHWSPVELAKRANVPLSVAARVQGNPGEPAGTITHLNALMQPLRTAGTPS